MADEDACEGVNTVITKNVESYWRSDFPKLGGFDHTDEFSISKALNWREIGISGGFSEQS